MWLFLFTYIVLLGDYRMVEFKYILYFNNENWRQNVQYDEYSHPNSISEKKEKIWLSPVTNAPRPTEKSKKQRDNIKTLPKTSITQRLRTDLGTVSWSSNSHPTGVVKPVYVRTTFPLTTTAM